MWWTLVPLWSYCLGRLEKLGPTWRKQVTRVGPCGYLVPAFSTLPCFLSVRKPLPLSPSPAHCYVMAHRNPLSRRLWIPLMCVKGRVSLTRRDWLTWNLLCKLRLTEIRRAVPIEAQTICLPPFNYFLWYSDYGGAE